MQSVSKILFIPLMAMFASCNSSRSKIPDRAALTFEWKKLGQLPDAGAGDHLIPNQGLAGPVAGIQGDYLIIGGGSNFPDTFPWEGGTKQYYDNLCLYRLSQNPDTATFIPVSATLPYKVGYPACVSTAGGIVVAGGENDQGPTAQVILIKMDTARTSPVITPLPALPEPSSGGMITAIGDKVYYAGGNTASGTSEQFLVLDLKDTAEGWLRLPGLPRPAAFGILYEGADLHTLYWAAGRKANTHARTTFFSSLFVFNIPTRTWQQKQDLPYPVSAATGIRFRDKLLLFGGDQGITFHQTEDLLLKIADTRDSAEKQILLKEKNILQEHHPGFTDQILCYDPAADKWSLTGERLIESQVTTTAIPWGEKVIIPCGEIRAGVRSPDIIEGIIQHSD